MTSVCRDEARGREAVAGLAREGLHPRYHALDITDEAAITRLRDHLREQHGGIDVLVNNAGVCFPADTQETLGTQAKVTLGINYWGNKVRVFPLLGYLFYLNVNVFHIPVLQFLFYIK